MQLYALDSNGQFLNARQARRQMNYFCKECNQIVRLRGGPHRQVHFYHLDPTPFCRQHQKGIVHLQLQAHFLQLLPEGDCRLEYHFPTVNRIADVAWLSKNLVFEIQYSPISAEEVLQRNHDYAQCGWRVVWILHDSRYNQFRVSPAEAALRPFPHYFSNMDRLGQGIIYDQFDHFDKRMRKYKLPPLPITMTQFNEIGEEMDSLSSFESIQKRLTTWPISFEGDLVSCFFKNPSSDYFRQIQRHEERMNSTANTKRRWRELFWDYCFVRPYRIFFRYLLERSCR